MAKSDAPVPVTTIPIRKARETAFLAGFRKFKPWTSKEELTHESKALGFMIADSLEMEIKYHEDHCTGLIGGTAINLRSDGMFSVVYIPTEPFRYNIEAFLAAVREFVVQADIHFDQLHQEAVKANDATNDRLAREAKEIDDPQPPTPEDLLVMAECERLGFKFKDRNFFWHLVKLCEAYGVPLGSGDSKKDTPAVMRDKHFTEPELKAKVLEAMKRPI